MLRKQEYISYCSDFRHFLLVAKNAFCLHDRPSVGLLIFTPYFCLHVSSQPPLDGFLRNLALGFYENLSSNSKIGSNRTLYMKTYVGFNVAGDTKCP